eukprot:7126957-Lingulodinium_polyedra.AAC.1
MARPSSPRAARRPQHIQSRAACGGHIRTDLDMPDYIATHGARAWTSPRAAPSTPNSKRKPKNNQS